MSIRTFRGRRVTGRERSMPARRLFCFPYAGAGAAIFRLWPDHLANDIEMCLPCLPGRDARVDESPALDMIPLVANLAHEMLPLLSVPYALFGHSMGAFIAFDLAHKLSGLGHPPAHLFVAAQRGPKLPYPGQPIYMLPDDQLLAGILARYDNIPRAVLDDAGFRTVFLRIFRADFTLVENYTYRASGLIHCPVTVFGGTDDRGISREQLEAWSGETTGRFRCRMLPGGHFFLNDARKELLSLMRAELDEQV
jgi:medium-chain acyl-[acyl-carrier-protein] hydrolase